MVEILKAVTLVVALSKFLGPWGVAILVGAIVALLFVFRAFGDKILEGVIEHHAHGLGKTLKDATLSIRSINPAPEPDRSVFRTGDDEEDDAFEADLEASGMPEGEYEWYKIDAEITPNPDAEGNPVTWDPEMIQLHKDDGKSRSALEIDIDCLKAQVEIWQDGAFAVHETGSVTGPARLRLWVGVTPGTRDVRFWYLGESLGRAQLPTRAAVTA